MRFFKFIFLLTLLTVFQSCSNEGQAVQDVAEDKRNAISTTTLPKTSATATTSVFDYSKVDYSDDEPNFLFTKQDSSQLSGNWRAELLEELRIAEPIYNIPYTREEWGSGWIDEDGNCINTRHEVLLEEAIEEVVFDDRGCKVISGEWYDYFSDSFFVNPSELDVDHMVPLANAHTSGAANWPIETKISFYNDLNDPQHLIAVDSSANRAKGAKGPEAWRPPNEKHWCQYAYSWIEIKARWNLSATESESDALREMLNMCDGLPEVTYWFANWLKRQGAIESQESTITQNEYEAESNASEQSDSLNTQND